MAYHTYSLVMGFCSNGKYVSKSRRGHIKMSTARKLAKKLNLNNAKYAHYTADLSGHGRSSKDAEFSIDEYRASLFNFSHDKYGNPNASYTLWKNGEIVHHQRRCEQCGYSDDWADGVLCRLYKLTSKHWQIFSKEGSRSGGQMNLTFEPLEA